jgi:hypothetical protein
MSCIAVVHEQRHSNCTVAIATILAVGGSRVVDEKAPPFDTRNMHMISC